MEELIRQFEALYKRPHRLKKRVLDCAIGSGVGHVVVLSGESWRGDRGWVIDRMTRERLRFALALLPQLKGAKMVLCGAEEQLLPMREAVCCYVDPENIVLVSAGPYATANTKTQFEALSRWAEEEGVEQAIVVSSLFHLLRVYLTALKQAPGVKWFVLEPTPEDEGADPRSEVSRVLGEIRRILEYSRKGDIDEIVALNELMALIE